MDINSMGNAMSECAPKPMRTSIGPASLKERLEEQKIDLEARLLRINAALEAMNSHPEVMQVLELVSKV